MRMTFKIQGKIENLRFYAAFCSPRTTMDMAMAAKTPTTANPLKDTGDKSCSNVG